MTDILVELESLAGLIGSLASSAEHMSSATGALKSVASADLGSGDLDSAAEDFQHKWGYGIGRISDAANKITDELRSAKSTYESIEQEAKAALEKLGAAMGVGSALPSGGAGDPAQSKIGKALQGGML